MANINPSREQVLRSLVDDAGFKRAVRIMTEAVEHSFLERPCRRTRAEVKRRFDKAYSIFKELRAEMRYPLARLADCLGPYLVLDLDGQEWSPLRRRTWVPGDSTG